VGMLLEPRSLAAQAWPIAVFTGVVLVGDTLGATLGGALAGLPLRTGFRTGLALAHAGEFSFVLVGIGVHARLLGPDFFAVPAGVCLLTALLGPSGFRHGDALAAGLEHRLPDRLNWYLKIYQSWAAKLGRSSLGRGPVPMRRPLIFLVLDAALINLVIIGASLLRFHLPWFRSARAATGLLAGEAALLVLLAWALCGRAGQIAGLVLAGPETRPGPAGRHLLLAAVSLALLLMVGAPSVVLLQPFLPRGPMLTGFLAGVGALLGLLWAHSHRFPPERALGSEWLLHRMQAPWAEAGHPAAPAEGSELASLRLTPRCPHLGLSLAELALEERTGVGILSLMRDGHPRPTDPGQRLQPGDVLTLAGPPAALEAARRLLGEA